MSDIISRQAAIREYQEVCKGINCGECPLLIKVNTEKGSHLITDCKLEAFLHDLPSAQPETAKRIVGKSRGGMTLWYQCDMCNEPVDAQDNFCRGCGRRLTDG